MFRAKEIRKKLLISIHVPDSRRAGYIISFNQLPNNDIIYNIYTSRIRLVLNTF